MNTAATEARLLLVGCGILRKEIRHLIARNDWPLDTVFLDSSLHSDLGQLQARLQEALSRARGHEVIVFYGTCHPLMDTILSDAQLFRTVGQNCAEMLLGKGLFDQELESGAFFLMEEWARRWTQITFKTFGTENLQVIRDIYRGDRTYMLCLRTPCSDDFEAMAQAAGDMVGLPIRWMDVPLDHLQHVLEDAIARKRGESP